MIQNRKAFLSNMIEIVGSIFGFIFLILMIDTFVYNWTPYDITDPLNFKLFFEGTPLESKNITSHSIRENVNPELMSICLELANKKSSFRKIYQGDITECYYDESNDLVVEFYE